MARIALVLVSFFAMSCNAWAWGDEGHKIVCEIAMRLAVPSTRTEIRRLIKTDTEFDFFADACTWPDHPRKRAGEHFVNLARDSSGLPRVTLAVKRPYRPPPFPLMIICYLGGTCATAFWSP